jgi:hypothetical protein
MREIRQSGLEGGVRSIPHSYPYHCSVGRVGAKKIASSNP